MVRKALLFLLVLLPCGGVLGQQVGQRTLAGVALDAQGKPVAGATITVFGSGSLQAKTGADGSFRIANVPGIEIGLTAEFQNLGLETPLRLKPPFPEQIKMTLVPVPQVTLVGRVVDAGGQPVADAKVRLEGLSKGPGPRHGMALNGTTDAEGRYRFTVRDLTADYGATVYGNDFRVREAVRPLGDQGAERRFPDMVVTPLNAAVAGRVVDARQQPVAGVSVFWVAGPRGRRSKTQADGAFRVEGIPAEPVVLAALAADGSAALAVATPGKDAVLILQAGLRPAGGSAPELFLDPWRAPGLVRRILADPSALKGFSRVHLIVFQNAQTLYPTRVQPFQQLPAFAGQDVPRQLAAVCRKANVRLTWAAELLRWDCGDVESIGLAAKHPEWFGLAPAPGMGGPLRDGRQDRSATPFDPQVHAALFRLIEEMAALSPQPEAIVLRCRMRSPAMVPFPAVEAEAYRKARGQDPPAQAGERERTLWREEYLAGLLRQLVDRLREKGFRGECLAWSLAHYHRLSSGIQVEVAENWWRWMEEGAVSQTLLDAGWYPMLLRGGWASYRERIQRGAAAGQGAPDAGKKAWPLDAADGGGDAMRASLARLHLLLRTRDSERQPIFDKMWAGMQQSGAPLEGLVFWPMADEDWEGVRAVVSKLSP